VQSINTPAWIPGLPFGANSFREEDDSFGQPTGAVVSFSEFYCESGGSNLNSGFNSGAAIYTSAGGNWSSVTSIFTPTDGVNPFTAGVMVGQFASIYVTIGATVATFISRITAVSNVVNGGITVLTSGGTGWVGAVPTTGSGTFTCKVGGAWLGPNAAVGFPFTLTNFGLNKNIASNQVRVNVKNDQTYSLTASFACDSNATSSQWVTQGYAVTLGDGGKATWDGGTSTATIMSDVGLAGNIWIDHIFQTSIGSGAFNLVTATRFAHFIRCVFSGARAAGVLFSSGNSVAYECEAYNCNRSNTANTGAFSFTTGSVLVRCISHDNLGTNTSGFLMSGGSAVLQNCISSRNGRHGCFCSSVANNAAQTILGCDFYKNVMDGVNIIAANLNFTYIENSNFIQNGGAAINNQSTNNSGFAHNNGYSDNVKNDTLNNITVSKRIIYAPLVTPWVDPVNGNFGISLPTAIGTGRGVFTETQLFSSTTIGYPDIGAAQASAIASPLWAGATFTCPVAFINHLYSLKQNYLVPLGFSLQSGTLPPGLTLAQLDSQTFLISGTPTTLGTYDFVIRGTQGTSFGDIICEIVVNADPDEGAGGVGGG